MRILGNRGRATVQRWAVLGAAGVIAGSLLAGCGNGSSASGGTNPVSGSWDDIVKAARQEGSVTLYSSQQPQNLQAFKAKFEETYPGIKLNYVRDVDSAQIPKVDAERRSGKAVADMVVNAAADWWAQNGKAGTFGKAVGPNFSSGEYGTLAKTQGYEDQGNYFEVGAANTDFGWNTKLYPQGLKSYTDLLAPNLAGGKVGVIQGTATSIVDFYVYLQKYYGEQFVEKLAAQKPRLYTSAYPMAQALGAGEISAAIYIAPLTDDNRNGAPVEAAAGNPPYGIRLYGGITAKAPHPNAAQVLANFMVSREGQQVVQKGAATVLPNVPGTTGYNPDIPRPDPGKLSTEAVREFNQKWKTLFQ